LLLHFNEKDKEHTLKAIKTILYAKEDENIEVDEEGNIVV